MSTSPASSTAAIRCAEQVTAHRLSARPSRCRPMPAPRWRPASPRVRDVGGDTDLIVAEKRAIAAGTIAGPRMWVAGAPLGPTGGHGDAPFGPRSAICTSRNGTSRWSTASTARIRVVRDHRRRGVDLIKIMPSGGVLSVGDDPSLQLMARRRDQGGGRHRPRAGHEGGGAHPWPRRDRPCRRRWASIRSSMARYADAGKLCAVQGARHLSGADPADRRARL